MKEFAEKCNLRLKRGTGEPLTPDSPYGPEPNEPYIPLKKLANGTRGFILKMNDGYLDATIFPTRIKSTFKELASKGNAQYTDEEVSIQFHPESPGVETILRFLEPLKKPAFSQDALLKASSRLSKMPRATKLPSKA